MAQVAANKPVHTILLDASPIVLNTPSISTLRATCTTLVTTAAVISEIRSEEARTRFESLYKPFIEVRSPKPESIKFVRDFAQRTGDLAVLSSTDIEVLALAYDLECERNGGDWRLRSMPGQKRVNGKPPVKEELSADMKGEETPKEDVVIVEEVTQKLQNTAVESYTIDTSTEGVLAAQAEREIAEEDLQDDGQVPGMAEEESADSDEGWITPCNIKRKQIKDEQGADTSNVQQKALQVGTMTGDFAMQNVLLQINLNLLSTKTCKRISNIKRTIFRCHACFQTTKDMTKQFCPRCGKPTLTRVTCTTNDKGEAKLHLKSGFQWNNRGNVYSIPKPTPGNANQKWKGPKTGGGQGGWGNDLMLAEDQKEYIRAVNSQKRSKQKDLMDEDSLPSILTGDRSHTGRIQVGAGRAVNSRKR